MPVVNKITEEVFNAATQVPLISVNKNKNCLPLISVLNGLKTEVTDDFGTVVKRGAYKTIVFVPDALLGEFRWNRIFSRNNKRFENKAIKNGVLFLFDPFDIPM